MKYIVILTDIVTITKVYQIEIAPQGTTYPSPKDLAISGVSQDTLVAEESIRDIKFKVIEAR